MLRNVMQPWHLAIVAVVFILLFGAKRLPDAARSLGKSLRILKSEAKALKEDGTQPAATYTAEPQASHAAPPHSAPQAERTAH
ncbi:Sec-independent protein translocase subunit TatA [Streptomyces sp. NPDC004111]|uniref:Sec-independent protein translocase subunit TatA n=1 Tax=Streptomyces sp. NPDC004111 TaxID=3364690 RepID=UPI00367E8B90